MSVAAKYKKMATFSGSVEMVELEYSFAADGGLVSVIDLGVAEQNMLIHRAFVKVPVACTSGGSATVEVGIKGGDTDALLAATAVASLTLNASFPGAAASEGLRVAANDVIAAEIKVAALTAGKLQVVIEFSKF